MGDIVEVGKIIRCFLSWSLLTPSSLLKIVLGAYRVFLFFWNYPQSFLTIAGWSLVSCWLIIGFPAESGADLSAPGGSKNSPSIAGESPKHHTAREIACKVILCRSIPCRLIVTSSAGHLSLSRKSAASFAHQSLYVQGLTTRKFNSYSLDFPRLHGLEARKFKLQL